MDCEREGKAAAAFKIFEKGFQTGNFGTQKQHFGSDKRNLENHFFEISCAAV
jgi:hypothetical protein